MENGIHTEEVLKQPNTSPKKKLHMRQQVVVFLLVWISMVIVTLIAGLSIRQYASSRIMNEMEDHVRTQAGYLAEKIYINDGVLDMQATDAAGIYMMANALNGRIVIIDTTYCMIFDSYDLDTQKYLVDQDIHEIMTGDSQDGMYRENHFIRYAFPVTGQDDQIQAVAIITADISSVKKIAAALRNQCNILLTVFIIISLLAGYVISEVSVRDVKRLKRQLKNMKDGLLGQVALEKVFYEVEELTSDINDIFAKTQMLEESRQEFVSNVSHELKTPITSMKVLSESLMMQENVPVETYREFMNDIVQEIDREAQIINDLLTLVRTDKGPDSLNFENVDMNALMDVILKRLKPLAEKRNIEVTYESFREINADIDKVKFTLAISNLIENGIKYNVDGGWIRVSLNADHKNLYIKVADSGVGIPEDCVDHIFERFYRVDKARSRDTGGTGLGLAISKNIIAMHKGTINVYSEPGKGTTFTVRVPMNYVKQENTIR